MREINFAKSLADFSVLSVRVLFPLWQLCRSEDCEDWCGFKTRIYHCSMQSQCDKIAQTSTRSKQQKSHDEHVRMGRFVIKGLQSGGAYNSVYMKLQPKIEILFH